MGNLASTGHAAHSGGRTAEIGGDLSGDHHFFLHHSSAPKCSATQMAVGDEEIVVSLLDGNFDVVLIAALWEQLL